MENEIKKLERIVFEHEGKKYCYEFELLTVEQAELAREAGEWKYNQIQFGTDNLEKLFSSRGAEYLSIIMSFLLREVSIDDTIKPFSKEKADREVLSFVNQLPASNIQMIRNCVEDFFYNIGKQQIGSLILQGVKKKSGIEMLLPIFQNAMLGR